MLDYQSTNIQAQKLQSLKNLFPEIFVEGAIDYEKLKMILGESINEASSEHSYYFKEKRC